MPTGRLSPKPEPTFGKKPYKGKQKNQKGSKIKSHSQEMKELYGGGNMLDKEFKHNRIKEVYAKPKNSLRGGMRLNEYMQFINDTCQGEAHHYLTKGRYGTFDCFIVMIHPTLHQRIHAGDIGVQGYIDQEGFENLVIKSMEHLSTYLDSCSVDNSDLADTLTLFIAEVLKSPSDALEIAKSFSDDVAGAKKLDMPSA